MRRIWACMFLLVAPLLAQNRFNGAPAGATGPAFEASVGYLYLSMAMPSQRVALEGADANGLVKLSTRWGATIDATYAHTGNVLGTGYNGNFLSCLAGPVFYPVVRPKIAIFVRAMAGAGLVDSAVPVSGPNYLGGWVARPSYAAGGGFEHSLFGPFSIRAGGDWQRTTFANSTGTLQVQNNLRVITSIAYRFGNR